MRNSYSGRCFKCNEFVKEGEGFFQKVNKGDGKLYENTKGKWVVRCRECVGKGNRLTTKER